MKAASEAGDTHWSYPVPLTCLRSANEAKHQATKKGRLRASLFFAIHAGESILQGLLDFYLLVRLDDVAYFDVIEALDVQSAFESFGHFLRIVLESL